MTVSNPATPGGGTSAATSDSTFTYLAPAVSNVTPAKGPTTGGGTVTISGSGFAGVQSVAFGGVDAAFQVDSAERMTAVVPAMPQGGSVNIIVTATSGSSIPTVADRYLYALPGYWLVASDGGLFGFGNAGFFGSAGDLTLNKPIVGMAPTSDDRGYWLVASDGGIFSYGDAQFYGSTGDLCSTSPSWAWPRPTTAVATGWWPPTAASSPSVMPSSTARPGTSPSTADRGHGPDPRRRWLLAGGQ